MSAASLTAGLRHPRDLRVLLNVSRAQMAHMCGVSARTIERWETRDDLPGGDRIRLRLQELQEIAELGRLVYTAQGMRLFLTTPMTAFDGRTAAHLIRLGRAEVVLGVLAGQYEGSVV